MEWVDLVSNEINDEEDGRSGVPGPDSEGLLPLEEGWLWKFEEGRLRLLWLWLEVIVENGPSSRFSVDQFGNFSSNISCRSEHLNISLS